VIVLSITILIIEILKKKSIILRGFYIFSTFFIIDSTDLSKYVLGIQILPGSNSHIIFLKLSVQGVCKNTFLISRLLV
jgi:hypothetical protein